MKKILLIDGSNMAVRASFANSELKNSDGVFTGCHFGTFNILITLKRKYPDYDFLILWDSRSARRLKESTDAVSQGIIPEVYKANRKKDELPLPLKNFYEQSDFLKRGIAQTGIPQIMVNGFEGDDVIASYVSKYKNDAAIVINSSDKDFLQLLDENVILFDGMKMSETTYDIFKNEWGISQDQYIDVCALMGDTSDNIFGVPTIGEKTALKVIKKYGSWEKVIEAYKKKYEKSRKDYPDLNTITDGRTKFDYLANKKSEKGRFVYPEISFDMPYTGVLLAFDQNQIDGIKTEMMSLLFEKRVFVAYSLKKMDSDIENLPEIVPMKSNKERLLEYFDYYDIETLKDAIDILL